MIIFFIILFVVIIAAFCAEKLLDYKLESRFLLTISFSIMVLFAGLRDRTVGTDTNGYVTTFERIHKYTDIKRVVAQSEEYGIWLLSLIVHSISDQYSAFLIAIALIVVGCYQFVIVKYSVSLSTSLFVFVTMGFYTFFFNGARQGIACAIYALAIGPLLQRKLYLYLFIVLLASIFHKSALLMLPFYFLFDLSNTAKKNMIIIVIGIILSLVYQRIADVGAQFAERYEGYGVGVKGGGYYMMALNVVLCTFFSICKKYINSYRDQYGLYLNMFWFGTMISVVSSVLSVNPSGFMRLVMYSNFSIVFLWPIFFKNIRLRQTKLLIVYIFTVSSLILFYLTTERFSNLVPYSINTQLSELYTFGGGF